MPGDAGECLVVPIPDGLGRVLTEPRGLVHAPVGWPGVVAVVRHGLGQVLLGTVVEGLGPLEDAGGDLPRGQFPGPGPVGGLAEPVDQALGLGGADLPGAAQVLLHDAVAVGGGGLRLGFLEGLVEDLPLFLGLPLGHVHMVGFRVLAAAFQEPAPFDGPVAGGYGIDGVAFEVVSHGFPPVAGPAWLGASLHCRGCGAGVVRHGGFRRGRIRRLRLEDGAGGGPAFGRSLVGFRCRVTPAAPGGGIGFGFSPRGTRSW